MLLIFLYPFIKCTIGYATGLHADNGHGHPGPEGCIPIPVLCILSRRWARLRHHEVAMKAPLRRHYGDIKAAVRRR